MAEVTIKLGNIGVEPIDQGSTGPGTDRSEAVLDPRFGNFRDLETFLGPGPVPGFEFFRGPGPNWS